jgi:transposase
MYLKFTSHFSATEQKHVRYFRLVESYRNHTDRICHNVLYNIGPWPGFTIDEQVIIVRKLNLLYKQQVDLFLDLDPKIDAEVSRIWNDMVAKKKIDRKTIEDQIKMVHIDTIKHTEVREIGAEWICYNTWNQLQLTEFFEGIGWSEEQIKLAQTQVIARAVYPASELATTRFIKENSAVCNLTGYDIDKLTKDKLYKSALALYEQKNALEHHLSKRTNDLFDLQDKIILYDLTNTYFEGRKDQSVLAKFGRSKERRKDAKLVVLALVVNLEGFIKYSSIHQGNYADTSDMSHVLENISRNTNAENPIVVLDAGIATKENINVLSEKKFRYVVVSRSKVKDYRIVEGCAIKTIKTKSDNDVKLTLVEHDDSSDYYLKVDSTEKRTKEKSMKNKFETSFVAELEKIKSSLTKKGGVKQQNKVIERIGRAKEKYPSIQMLFDIEYEIEESTKLVTTINWSKNPLKDSLNEEALGTYFIRTNMDTKDENLIWTIYNSIREIESSFRCLKTDLDLRPIYHKNDDATMAHLHLGILAYWLVNTIRFQLKQSGIKNDWTEIRRIANTQKLVSTSAQNTFDKTIHTQRCSEPSEKLIQIQKILYIKSKPFKMLKSVGQKPPPKKIETIAITQNST